MCDICKKALKLKQEGNVKLALSIISAAMSDKRNRRNLACLDETVGKLVDVAEPADDKEKDVLYEEERKSWESQ